MSDTEKSTQEPAAAPRTSVIHEGLPTQLPDIDPDETQDWLESFDALVEDRGRDRARYLMLRLLERAREKQVGVPALRSTDYINTIPPEREPWFPGDEEIERRIRAFIRWNAAVMVSDANRPGLEVGGHIATYQSAASLYEVGFNHFFRGKEHPGGGDQVYIQGHGSPGIYARAYLEGRLTEEQLMRFRQEVQHGVGKGLPSYPHPRLMPEFWEFPTVSMGLTAINSIYQARFNRYLQNRGIKDTSEQHVWAFLGDGEMAEPESLGAIGVAAREELDNLTWVINCNLQQLDGPVRGNGKIIQELESQFRGAGWNVIKVIWGREWDALLARDVDGVLVNQMNSTPDGQFQTYSVEDGAYNREHFFGADPRLRKMVEHMTDRQIEKLPRGGHDYRKVYAAFDAAAKHVGQPTVILAHTVKGWTIESLEGRNATHQMKKLKTDDFKKFRDRLYLPMSDKDIDEAYEANGGAPFFHPGPGLPRDRVHDGAAQAARRSAAQARGPRQAAEGARRRALRRAQAGLGQEQDRHHDGGRAAAPRLDEGQGDRPAHRADRARRVPHLRHGLDVPERQGLQPGRPALRVGRPQAAAQVARGRPTASCSTRGSPRPARWHRRRPPGSSYSTHGEVMIPFYIFYSMFGFQRTGDSIWAMADQLARGFLIGATAGRTTLTGEGLQHADGHSPLLAATNPAVVHYDPAFAHEVAHIMQDGLRRMYTVSDDHPQGEDVIFYITVYNEPMVQPKEPENLDVEGLLKGIYHYADAPEVSGNGDAPRIQLLASGVGLPVDPEGAAAARRRLGRGRRPVVGDLVERARARRGRGREVDAEPPQREGEGPLHHQQAGERHRSRGGGERLHARRTPADRALGADRLPRARHRRVRLRRHPPGGAALLPGRRGERRRDRAACPGRPGRGQGGGGRRGVLEVPHRRPDRGRRRQAGGRRRMTAAWATAIRRGIIPLVLGIVCFVLAWPAIEDLDGLFKGVGAILVVLGLVIIVATARTLTAEEKRIGPGPRRASEPRRRGWAAAPPAASGASPASARLAGSEGPLRSSWRQRSRGGTTPAGSP